MKKFNYSEIETLGYRPFIQKLVHELNESGIKPYDYEEFLYDENYPDASFLGGIATNLKAVEYLKEIGLLNNGICPLCGRRPIDVNFTFTSGLNRNINFHICKNCYKVGNQTSVNPTNKEGCFIATLCYNDYDAPEVLVFRRFRDEILNKNFLGQLFIKFYYIFSPKIVSLIKNKPKTILIIKTRFLDPLYARIINRSKNL